MTAQESLLASIQAKIGKDSLHVQIADVLGISYDAAHRRIRQKSKFSMEEALLLSSHFSIALDGLGKQSNHLLCTKSIALASQQDFSHYLKNASLDLKDFKSGATFYYSAKDIPLFYTLGGNLVTKFKWYTWLNLVSQPDQLKPFEHFLLEVPLANDAQKLKQIYTEATVHEIWNDTTLNSMLSQIDYYHEAGLLNRMNAQALLEDLNQLLTTIEHQVTNNPNYHLYYHELLLMNNNVLVEKDTRKKLFVPFTMISYLVTDDFTTTEESAHFFKLQIQNAKCINTSGPKDRLQFFARNRQKIEWYVTKFNSFL